MRRYTLVAIILVSLITLSPLLSTQGHAIIRHPAEFSAEPVVKGYKFYSPLEARLYARIMQGIALLIAYANVTDVAVSRASCLALSPSIPLLAPYPPGWESILSLPPSSLIKYRATIVGWNRDIPNSTFIVEPVASPSQAWSILAPLLPVPVGSNASLIMRASPNQTLINLSKSLGRMAASHSIETVSNQTAILARNLTSAIGPELLSVKVHWALSTLDGLLDNREAQYVSPCGTAAIMTGGYPTASPDKVINIAERTSRTSQFAVFLAELVLQSAVAVEEVTIQTPQGNMTIRNLTVMVSPVIGGLGGDREGALEKVGIASNMLANFVSSMGTVITKPPKLGAAQPANVTKLLEDVESGNESTALQAIMEAQSLLEQGLISQEDLNKLVEAFKEKYGYDPLNTQPPPPPSKKGKTVEEVNLDLSEILRGINQYSPAGGGGGKGKPLPGQHIRLRPPKISGATLRGAAKAVALGGLLIFGYLALTYKESLELLARAALGRPPKGLSGRELAEWCYEAIIILLGVRGLPKMAWETPSEYYERVAPLLEPDMADKLRELTEAYERAVYAMEDIPRSASLKPCRHMARKLRNPRWKPHSSTKTQPQERPENAQVPENPLSRSAQATQ